MSSLQQSENVFYTSIARDCVIDSYVIICSCSCDNQIAVKLTQPKVSPTMPLWAWQDNIASGDGFCAWQSNVSVHPEPMGRWSS